MLRLEWYVFEEIRTIRSTKRKNCNRACQEKEATDHWHFGSIAQVTIATVYIASLDVIPQAFKKLASVFAVRNLCTILYKVIDGCAAISASIWAFTQASESEGHVVSFLLTKSAQLFCESHW